jgi:hypothetical protein
MPVATSRDIGAVRHSCTLTYTEAMVRDAVRTYVWRRIVQEQKGLWFAVVFLALLMGWRLSIGDRSWFVGFIGAFLLLPPLLLLTAWRAHYVNTVGTFRRMATPKAQLTLGENGFAIASDLGSGDRPWSQVTEIWERPDYWMVFTAKNQFNTWPMAELTADARDWLRTRISGNRSTSCDAGIDA